ncbi:hypothetical protein SAMN05660860_01532 [Geoalkalibacter ferrihydriticus]|uniref:Type II secretion system protein PulP n=1 Tax=Geoalkalibacter ferrihydriticus TaxID=392333 RepID=A0A1G9PAB7_9BACT|nr:hypothetical protein [Geoalkalibacter ferrihydriticus]SDL95644.1 hypothetical protein SAMN05660860_01532 [Geoalkalibacter ferrihydriticus]
MTRPKKILAVCLVLLVLAAGYAWWQTPRQQQLGETATTVRTPAVSRRAATPAPPPVTDDARLRLELLETAAEEFPGFQRDLFGPLFAAPPGPPPAPPAPPVPAPPPQPAEAPAPPEPVAVAPQVRFKVLGFVEVGKERTVFLDRDGDVYLAREGQSFGRDFLVTELSRERLVIEQQGRAHPIILPLEEPSGVSVLGAPGAPATQPGAPRRLIPPPRPTGR